MKYTREVVWNMLQNEAEEKFAAFSLSLFSLFWKALSLASISSRKRTASSPLRVGIAFIGMAIVVVS